MGSGQPTQDKVISRAAEALGLKDPSALVTISRKALLDYTQRQLTECCRHLGMKGVSKLNKEELADRIIQALQSASGEETQAEKKEADLPRAPEVSTTQAEAPEAEATPPLTHKFELGARGKGEEPTTIPWSYGYDRVTGMAVDPERLFVYWEVLDESIAKARAGLGAGGKDAWLCLRVYDTTGRIFDGTNAHAYFDHSVDREARQWFFHIGKPSSSAFVDVGMKSREGYFVKIARSGRVDFPRCESVAFSEPEWLSVRSVWGPVEHAGRGAHRRQPSAPPGEAEGPGPGGPPPSAPRRHVALLPWEETIPVGEGGRSEVTEWEEQFVDGSTEYHRHTTWESPVMVSSWEAGPFSHPVESPEAVREDFVGPTRVYRVGGRVHVVHGPWQVVIRGIGAHYGRAVVARWEIFRSWVAREVKETTPGDARVLRKVGASELLVGGASERLWRYGSEMRLAGASEIFFLGASEVKARGASERLYMGASQWALRGASERYAGGASEIRMRGASERMLAGASERRLGGASERRLGGASEARLGGSEVRLGGASEGQVHDGDHQTQPNGGGGEGAYPPPESVAPAPQVKD